MKRNSRNLLAIGVPPVVFRVFLFHGKRRFHLKRVFRSFYSRACDTFRFALFAYLSSSEANQDFQDVGVAAFWSAGLLHFKQFPGRGSFSGFLVACLIAAEKQAARFRGLLPGKHIARPLVSHGMQAVAWSISAWMQGCFHRGLIGKKLFIHFGTSSAVFSLGGMTAANRGCGAAIA
ncbi:MAG: hypothetical protein L6Q67_17495 [Zoogloea sp.]|nr:hypothetical protein [Zoogloea sp.]